jgi:hypothetical protein
MVTKLTNVFRLNYNRFNVAFDYTNELPFLQQNPILDTMEAIKPIIAADMAGKESDEAACRKFE